jgi:hypothetical protein
MPEPYPHGRLSMRHRTDRCLLVVSEGLEPPTSSTSRRHSSQLSYETLSFHAIESGSLAVQHVVVHEVHVAFSPLILLLFTHAVPEPIHSIRMGILFPLPIPVSKVPAVFRIVLLGRAYLPIVILVDYAVNSPRLHFVPPSFLTYGGR